MCALHNAFPRAAHVFTTPKFKAEDLFGIGRSELADVAAPMRQHICPQSQQIAGKAATKIAKFSEIERFAEAAHAEDRLQVRQSQSR